MSLHTSRTTSTAASFGSRPMDPSQRLRTYGRILQPHLVGTPAAALSLRGFWPGALALRSIFVLSLRQ